MLKEKILVDKKPPDPREAFKKTFYDVKKITFIGKYFDLESTFNL